MEEKKEISFQYAIKAEQVGRKYMDMGLIEKGLEQYEEALKIFEEGERIEESAKLCLEMSKIWKEAQNYTKAVDFVLRALEYFPKIPNYIQDPSYLESLKEAADLFWIKRDFEKSEEYLRECMIVLEELRLEGKEDMKVDIMLRLSSICEMKGEKDACLDLLRQSILLFPSLSSSITTDSILSTK